MPTSLQQRRLIKQFKKKQRELAIVADSALKPIPDTWLEFARLLKIRSGGKVVQFNPYDYQQKIIEEYERNSTILVKSRQLGASELTLSYMLYCACKSEGYTGLVVSMTGADSSILAKRLQYMVLSLEDYITLESDSLLYIKIRGKGEIFFRSGVGNPGRGIPSISGVFIDEAASITNLEESVNAIIPAMSMVGDNARIFIVSTPKGRNGYYAERLQQVCPNAFDICDEIRLQKIEPFQTVRNDLMKMSTCFVSWREHPKYGKNPNFLQEKAEQQGLTLSAVSQEYDLNFSIEESNVFSTDEIMKLTNTEVLPESQGDGESLYWAGIDVAYGNSGDYLVCTIFKTIYNLMPDGSTKEEYHLVAMYPKNKNTMNGYVYDLVELFERFNVWMVSYESNAGGKLVADELERLYPSATYHKVVTTRNSKEAMLEGIKLLIERDKIKVPSETKFGKQLTKEMLSYCRDENGRYSGGKTTDDCVMALAVGVDGILEYGVGRGRQSI
ncbi:MAG: hypothetical protein AB4368_23565 [Xenococcaceae cyanobacterium]